MVIGCWIAQKYILYSMSDPVKQARGIRFRVDAERQKMELALPNTLSELNNQRRPLQAMPPTSAGSALARAHSRIDDGESVMWAAPAQQDMPPSAAESAPAEKVTATTSPLPATPAIATASELSPEQAMPSTLSEIAPPWAHSRNDGWEQVTVMAAALPQRLRPRRTAHLRGRKALAAAEKTSL